jgi:hypothetical protein
MQRLIAAALAAAAATIGSAEPRRAAGEWSVTRADGIQVASATNDAGATVGILCFLETERCLAFLVTGDACRDGATVPMMLNSPAGSNAITTTCRHFPTGQEGAVGMMSVVTEYGAMRTALESGGAIGVAIPMESGAFHVLRFRTAGATDAIRSATALPRDRRRTPATQPASTYL